MCIIGNCNRFSCLLTSLNLSCQHLLATGRPNFAVVARRDWLIEGGEVGHSCGQLHRKLSAVFSGVAATRRLCTPLIDLTHVGSTHFWFSFGISCLVFFHL